MKLFKLWSEWDIGESHIVFSSRSSALRWLHNNAAVAEMAIEDNQSIENIIPQYFADGYFALEEVELI